MSEFITANPSNYPHWGACSSCGQVRDLNRDLYCVTCQEALNTAKALMVLENVKFTQSLPFPTPKK